MCSDHLLCPLKHTRISCLLALCAQYNAIVHFTLCTINCTLFAVHYALY